GGVLGPGAGPQGVEVEGDVAVADLVVGGGEGAVVGQLLGGGLGQLEDVGPGAGPAADGGPAPVERRQPGEEPVEQLLVALAGQPLAVGGAAAPVPVPIGTEDLGLARPQGGVGVDQGHQ